MPETCPDCGCKLGRTVTTPIDSSLAFTALLELYPGYGQLIGLEAEGLRQRFLDDWLASGHAAMYAYAREWVAANPPGSLVVDVSESTGPCSECGGGYWQEYAGPPAGQQHIPHELSCSRNVAAQAAGTAEPSYGANADGNPYAQYTPEHRVWEKARQNGKGAAQWVFDGNTSQAAFRQALGWIRDGDPSMEELEPRSLRGDYTDEQLLADAEWVPHDGTDLREDLIAQYDTDARAAFWHEVEATCLRQLSHRETGRETQLGQMFITCSCGHQESGGAYDNIAERNMTHHLKLAREA